MERLRWGDCFDVQWRATASASSGGLYVPSLKRQAPCDGCAFLLDGRLDKRVNGADWRNPAYACTAADDDAAAPPPAAYACTAADDNAALPPPPAAEDFAPAEEGVPPLAPRGTMQVIMGPSWVCYEKHDRGAIGNAKPWSKKFGAVVGYELARGGVADDARTASELKFGLLLWKTEADCKMGVAPRGSGISDLAGYGVADGGSEDFLMRGTWWKIKLSKTDARYPSQELCFASKNERNDCLKILRECAGGCHTMGSVVAPGLLLLAQQRLAIAKLLSDRLCEAPGQRRVGTPTIDGDVLVRLTKWLPKTPLQVADERVASQIHAAIEHTKNPGRTPPSKSDIATAAAAVVTAPVSLPVMAATGWRPQTAGQMAGGGALIVTSPVTVPVALLERACIGHFGPVGWMLGIFAAAANGEDPSTWYDD
jgi:hypothetical protein